MNALTITHRESGDGGVEDPEGGCPHRRGVPVHVLPERADSQGDVLAADPAGEAGQVLLRMQHQHGALSSSTVGLLPYRCGVPLQDKFSLVYGVGMSVGFVG